MNTTEHEALAPVITIDGPSGAGKGTLAHQLAKKLGWHFLDSGLLYRVLAYAAMKQQLSFEVVPELVQLARTMPVVFDHGHVRLGEDDITKHIRTEAAGNAASKVGVIPEVRMALLQRQRDFRMVPGLVTDGRDMGTVVFPDAPLKFFITASPEERAKRRFMQLQDHGNHVSLQDVLDEVKARDLRDQQRTIAPLKPASDAIVVDTTRLAIAEVLAIVMEHVERVLGPSLSKKDN